MRRFVLIGIMVFTTAEIGLAGPVCSDVLEFRQLQIEKLQKRKTNNISEQELLAYVQTKIPETKELNFIREQAKKMGVRVWMFGGTASSFLHYTKWDLARQRGMLDLQQDRFDFDFTNIFRSTQDLDIVVDGDGLQIQAFQKILADQFPYFVGSKKAWEVRSLRQPIGRPGDGYYKEALLDDPNFSNQNTDTNSLAMVEISYSKEPIVRDLRSWTSGKNQFLEDALNNTITYLRNPLHKTTARAKMGQNPEILSVLRLLVKAFQYDLEIDPKSMADIKAVIAEFDPYRISDQTARRRINEVAAKTVMHASNIERAIKTMDELGLRKKLLSMGLSGDENFRADFWLKKEPLRQFDIEEKNSRSVVISPYQTGKLRGINFRPTGRTAKDLGLIVVAHETNSFLAYESITRSHTGQPNVLISRHLGQEESAVFGDGFYTKLGKQGARGTGFTIRFTVDPRAREGVDFVVHESYIIFRNRKALTVIQESLNLGIGELIDQIESGTVQLTGDDLGISEKLKRRLNSVRIGQELEALLKSQQAEDQMQLDRIVIALSQKSIFEDIIGHSIIDEAIARFYEKIKILKNSKEEIDQIRYISYISVLNLRLRKLKILSKADSLAQLSEFRRKRFSNKVIAAATIEWALVENPIRFMDDMKLDGLSKEVKVQIAKEIAKFANSSDRRKKEALGIVLRQKQIALSRDDLIGFKELIRDSLLELNQTSFSGHSLLLEAAYYDAKEIIDFLIKNPNYDFTKRNDQGFNEVEQLRLVGKSELADLIESTRPEARGRAIKTYAVNRNIKTDTYPHGIPIIDFVDINPGQYMINENVFQQVKLTKPFQVASTLTTQNQWRLVVELGQQFLSGNAISVEASKLVKSPSRLVEPLAPVDQVSPEDVDSWTEILNSLSSMDRMSEVHKFLAEAFPGHRPGDRYKLPTEAEFEYVARVQGLATGKYTTGDKPIDLDSTVWLARNAVAASRPVGLSWPTFINGKPLYDVLGNIGQLTSDHWSGQRSSGENPQNITSPPTSRAVRGGSFRSHSSVMNIEYRNMIPSNLRSEVVGFRLYRTRP